MLFDAEVGIIHCHISKQSFKANQVIFVRLQNLS